MFERGDKLDVVAIDGPSGVGKSTVSRKVAFLLKYAYLDTGAMYRAVGYYLQNRSIAFENEGDIFSALSSFDIQLFPAKKEEDDVEVFVNGENISLAIRRPEMAMIASQVSTVAVVREFLTKLQRSQGRKGKIVAEGRDIGTVVFPQASYKFFLEAQPEERARRRFEQLRTKGIVIDYQEVLQQILDRDSNDKNRTIAPLRMAEDATLIDTTNIKPDKVVSMIVEKVQQGQKMM